jgi:hypothetical protein
MKNIYEQSVLEEIKERINKLTPQSQALWGKMNVSQMLAHCSATVEAATGDRKHPRMLLGRILGPIAKPSFTGPKPFAKSTPTAKEFTITHQPDFEHEKNKLVDLVQRFSSGGAEKCTTHPHMFFGKLTPEEWSIGMYKHLDHHLRQFGV